MPRLFGGVVGGEEAGEVVLEFAAQGEGGFAGLVFGVEFEHGLAVGEAEFGDFGFLGGGQVGGVDESRGTLGPGGDAFLGGLGSLAGDGFFLLGGQEVFHGEAHGFEDGFGGGVALGGQVVEGLLGFGAGGILASKFKSPSGNQDNTCLPSNFYRKQV